MKEREKDCIVSFLVANTLLLSHLHSNLIHSSLSSFSVLDSMFSAQKVPAKSDTFSPRPWLRLDVPLFQSSLR
jgi:hypothetical protein